MFVCFLFQGNRKLKKTNWLQHSKRSNSWTGHRLSITKADLCTSSSAGYMWRNTMFPRWDKLINETWQSQSLFPAPSNPKYRERPKNKVAQKRNAVAVTQTVWSVRKICYIQPSTFVFRLGRRGITIYFRPIRISTKCRRTTIPATHLFGWTAPICVGMCSWVSGSCP